MRLLVSRFEEEAEQEGRRIASRLHDDIGQNLTVLVFLLDRVRRSPGERSLAELEQAQKIASEMMAKVRDISLAVRPPIPDEVGLLAPLEVYLEELTARTGIQPDFRHSGLEKQLPHHVATAIYFIIQKAANCLGKSGVPLAIAIRVNEKSVSLSVAAGAAAAGISSQDDIQWIRGRAEYLGGTFNFSSSPVTGSRIKVRLPLFVPISKATGLTTIGAQASF